ncbi:MAG: hypothetical protein P9L90_05370 [Candidatus Aadella gelida]|nr:hypothetical protein [Candidatus Aadella gelida]
MNSYNIISSFGIDDRIKDRVQGQYPESIQFVLHGTDKNISHGLDKLLKELKISRLTDEVLDLYEIATIVYAADKKCGRGKREDWIRNMDFYIPVRNLIFWETQKRLLEDMISFLSGDNVRMNFSQYNSTCKSQIRRMYFRRRKQSRQWREKFDNVDSVALFSGGLDSTSGAIRLMGEGLNPILVKVTGDGSKASDIVKFIGDRLDKTIPHIHTQAKPSGGAAEESQRMRSFYFLSIAFFVANRFDIKDIFINEHSIMTIHLPLTMSRIGSFSTHTAHPIFLDKFAQLANSLTDNKREFRVRNIFALATKGEVVDSICEDGFKDIIKHTSSCAHLNSIKQTIKNIDPKSQPLGNIHCGYCVPCVIRYFAVKQSKYNLEDKDDVEYYFSNNILERFLSDEVNKSSGIAVDWLSSILGVMRLVNDFMQMNDIELLIKYPEITESEIIGLEALDIISVHRRFAREIMSAINEKIPDYKFLIDKEFQKKYENDLKRFNFDDLLASILEETEINIKSAAYDKISKKLNDYRWIAQFAVMRGLIKPHQLQSTVHKFVSDIAKAAKERGKKNITSRDIGDDELCHCPPWTS